MAAALNWREELENKITPRAARVYYNLYTQNTGMMHGDRQVLKLIKLMDKGLLLSFSQFDVPSSKSATWHDGKCRLYKFPQFSKCANARRTNIYKLLNYRAASTIVPWQLHPLKRVPRSNYMQAAVAALSCCERNRQNWHFHAVKNTTSFFSSPFKFITPPPLLPKPSTQNISKLIYQTSFKSLLFHIKT